MKSADCDCALLADGCEYAPMCPVPACEPRAALVDAFAKRFGLLASGTMDERRFRHEARSVSVSAVSDSYAVTFDFAGR